ncbi:GTPase domain-containing protein [Rubritalea tangerina]|uniref:GTPase domain-containing protein n=1 Tax=Rubritalea tangerina TaxID=430798 RepID=A0ABW4ZBW7_9BACT
MLGEDYLETRDALIDLIRLTRALAKRSKTAIDESEESMEESLKRPYRFVVIGETAAGKTRFLEKLTGVGLSHLEQGSPSVAIIRDSGYRVFDKAEDPCEKHYTTRLKGFELVEVHGYSRLSEDQLAAMRYLMDGADFVFWLFPAENPWSASTWDSVERDYAHAAMKSALLLHQADRRDDADTPMLMGHMKELCEKRVERTLPIFATSIHADEGMQACFEYVNLTLNRSVDRRRELRNVYKQCYALLGRTEENIDDRSRSLAGDQEFLQSIEAQIDRMREEEVRHVIQNMSQLSKLLASQVKRIVRFTSLRTGVVASHFAIFGSGDTASKCERYMIDRVRAEAEEYARKESGKMRQQCREKWQEMRPHLEDRLTIDVGDFSEESFDIQEEAFVEGMSKAVGQSLLHLKLRRFLDVLVMRRYHVMRKCVKWALFFISLGALLGYLGSEPLGVLPLCVVGLGTGLLVMSVIYSRKTGWQLRRSFAESLEDAVPALRKALREGYIDRVRAYYNGYTPMFESMRRLISDAKTELVPQQKIAGQLFLRLKSLEQEI